MLRRVAPFLVLFAVLAPGLALPDGARAGDEEEDAVPASSVVALHAFVYVLPRGASKALLGECGKTGTRFLDAPGRASLEASLQGMRDVSLIGAPAVVVVDGEVGTIKIQEPLSYVASFRSERRGEIEIQHPVLEVVQEGLTLEVRPVVSENRRSIRLEGSVVLKAVPRPIATKKVEVDDGAATVEVQVPEVREGRLDLHVSVLDGATVVGDAFEHPTFPGREVLVLLTARRHRGPGLPPLPLTSSKRSPKRAVTMDVRFLHVVPEVLAAVLGGKTLDGEHPLHRLDAAAAGALLGRGQKGAKGVEILSAPRLTSLDRQKANVSLLTQTSYVRKFDVKETDEGVVLDPVVETIQDGFVFEATPRIEEDGAYIAFRSVTTWAVLDRPIREFQQTIRGIPAAIQVPELRVHRVRQAFRLEDGGFMLIGGFGDAGEEGDPQACVLFHATVTALSADEHAGDATKLESR